MGFTLQTGKCTGYQTESEVCILLTVSRVSYLIKGSEGQKTPSILSVLKVKGNKILSEFMSQGKSKN